MCLPVSNCPVNVSFVKPNGEAVWEEPRISSFGVYQADTETEDEGKTQALEKLGEIIVNRTVRNWETHFLQIDLIEEM
jgi:hypothetical protein